MDSKWKRVAKENLESLKDINPDKANKDQYLLYAASMALLDHAEPQSQSKLDNAVIEYDGDKSFYAEYMDHKRVYRESGDDADKRYMISALDKYISGLSSELEELIRDADCHEERKTIKKYLNKIQSV